MNQLVKFLLSALIVLLLSRFFSGVHVDDYLTAVLVSLVLGLLNFIVKPILTLLTLPITIVTLGLFLLVINGIIIILVSKLVSGFHVDSIWVAILFSVMLTILESIVYGIVGDKKK